MCGIAGILTFGQSDAALASAAISRMVAALRHRGPDGEGEWREATPTGQVVAFGHARLSIIDLSNAGAQPMTRFGAAVTYNGEIYNYRALRDELAAAGQQFTSRSDTEVLLGAYARWGTDAITRLAGMFAFGLWDAHRRRLLLARDRFGIKPLYYHHTSDRLIFASEVRALLASGLVPRELEPTALWHYLGYQTTPTPMTWIRGVRMLEPGQVMEIEGDGRTTTRRYWDLLEAAGHEQPAGTRDAAERRIGSLLEDAVTSHMVSDVPVGVFLSGGLDSGALVSTLVSAGVRPQTFTVALDEQGYDESRDAASVAAQFGTDHAEIRLRDDDLLGMLPEVLAATDHPSGDAVNSFVVSKAVRARGLKVALSGLGGDEIFGGYASFRRLGRMTTAAERIGRAPGALRRAAAGVVRAAGRGAVATDKAAAVLESEGTLADTWPVTRQLFSPRARRGMLRPEFQPPDGAIDAYAAMLAPAFGASPDAGVWARVSYAEARAYMHDVLLRDTDQMSMAHGLEVRVPLLDHRLASYVVALPDAWKQGQGPKALLAHSLARPLPPHIVGRAKRGFTLPFDVWMRGALSSFCESQLGERGLDARGLLKPGEGLRLWTRFLNRAPGVTWGRVWSLVALNAWLDRQSL